MHKRLFLILFITLALASCGKHEQVYPAGIDHPPTEDENPSNSTVDNSGNSPTESPASDPTSGSSNWVGVNVEIQPVMVRGAITQKVTSDNIQPGT